MPRKPFDTTCDVFKGPGSATPGAFVGTFACRVVIEDGIHATGPGCPNVPAYLTIEDYEPVGAWEVPAFGMDASLADQIAVPSGDITRFWVLYTDVIIWKAQHSYYRGYLVYLPIPYPVGTGGIVFGGNATIFAQHEFVAQGGIVFGGSAVVDHGSVIIPAGGIVFGGEASIQTSDVFYPTGGILLGGDTSNEVTRMRRIYPAGGFVIGGDASISFTPGITYYRYDTFTDTNGTLLTAHTGEVTPTAYTNLFGSMKIESNKAVHNSNAGGLLGIHWVGSQTTYTWQLDWAMPTAATVSLDRYVFFQFRYLNDNNRVYAYVLFPSGSTSASGWNVIKVVAGSATSLASGSVTLNEATNYTFQVVVNPTSFAITINGTTVNYIESANGSNTNFAVVWSCSTYPATLPYMDTLKVFN